MVFLKKIVKIEKIVQKGTDAILTRGNVATLANRGKLPCMWFMDSSFRITVGADKNNPPIPSCENCSIPGGPIVNADKVIPSRAYCHFFGDPQNYYSYSNGFNEWCWGQNVNSDGFGEATWQFNLRRELIKKLEFVKLEIGDYSGSNGRLHSNKAGDLAEIFINGKPISQYVLDLKTTYNEYVWRDGTHQPLDPERKGKLLDITQFVDTNRVDVMIKVGPYIKWDISTVSLHTGTREVELTPFSYTIIGFVLGLIGKYILSLFGI